MEKMFSSDFIKLENYRLDIIPINVITESSITWSDTLLFYCSVTCLLNSNCKTAAIRKDDSLCNLYDTSVASLGSKPVYDEIWNSFIKGKRYMNDIQGKGIIMIIIP